MKVEILRSSCGGETTQQFAISYLVNDHLAIDAGSLGFAWPLERQTQVKDVFISHSHADHIASLPLFIENVYVPGPESPLVFAGPHTQQCLCEDVFNDRVWPDFVSMGTSENAFLEFRTLTPNRVVKRGDLTITPISVNHNVPTLGFLVSEPGSSVLFVSDTGPTDEIWEIAAAQADLKAVFLEASFPNNMQWLADVSHHLTPGQFQQEYGKLGRDDVDFLAVHIKAAFRKQVIDELTALDIPRLIIGSAETPYVY